MADFGFLKQFGVVQMLRLGKEKLPPIRAKNVVYFIQNKASLVKVLACSLREEAKKATKDDYEYHILFMPTKSWLCEKILKDENVFDMIKSVHEYRVEIMPIDNDILSMQMTSSLQELFIDKDYSSLLHVARAIIRIQSLFGIIENIYGHGLCAKRVANLLSKLGKEVALQEFKVVPQIHSMLILDRNVDFITPLLSQRTYEGLIDEKFGIHNGAVKISVDKIMPEEDKLASTPSSSGANQELKSFKLNSSDQIYAEIRDKTFWDVGPILKENTRKLTILSDQRHSKTSVDEMKQFLKKVPQIQAMKKSIADQTSIGALIKKEVEKEEFVETVENEHEFLNCLETDKICTYIEDCISRQEPITKVLRLIALQSLTNSGHRSKVIEYYYREILQTYGYQHLVTFDKLENAGIIKVKNSSTTTGRSYSALRKTFRLTRNKGEVRSDDLTYIYTGYAPLTGRIVEFLSEMGWKILSEMLKTIPGPTFELHQPIPSGLGRRKQSISSIKSDLTKTDEPKVILLFFIGGVTYSEISALRLISRKSNC